MKKHFVFLLAFVFLFNYGCKKDEKKELNQLGLIKSMTFKYSDESFKGSYEYDSQNRVKKINFYDGTSYDGYSNVFYNSDGKINKVDEYDSDNFKIGKSIFTYSENQLTIIYSYYYDYDEEWYEDGKEVFDYNSNKLIVKYESFEKYSMDWSLSESSIFDWTNNNLIKETSYYCDMQKSKPSKNIHRTIFLKTLAGKSLNFSARIKSKSNIWYTQTYQFDTKNNPFWDFNAASYSAPRGLPLLSKNNPTSCNKIYANYPNETYNETYSYEFNENDYPILISATSSYTEKKNEDYDYQIEIEYY